MGDAVTGKEFVNETEYATHCLVFELEKELCTLLLFREREARFYGSVVEQLVALVVVF